MFLINFRKLFLVLSLSASCNSLFRADASAPQTLTTSSQNTEVRASAHNNQETSYAKIDKYVEPPLFADNIVSIPSFPYGDPFTERHKSSREDQFNNYGSSMSLPLPPQLLRARNLLTAGHNEEAIIDYAQGAPQWKVPLRLREPVEAGWAIACERTGNFDEAIKHAKAAHGDQLIARLFLRQHKFAEAKAIADNRVLDWTILERETHYSTVLRVWLRMRACAEYGLSDYAGAVRDLKSAAEKYYTDDAKGAVLCEREANALIKRFKLGAAFKLGTKDLPANGKSKVLALVKFLVSSKSPLSVPDLNALTGAHIKLPNKIRKEIYQEDDQIPPFDHLEYRVQYDDARVPDLLSMSITTNSCCVPRSEIDSLFPRNAVRIPAIDQWSGSDRSEFAEAWKIPTGRLYMCFGKSGARVLENIEFNAVQSEKHVNESDRLKSELNGLALVDANKTKRIDLLTKTIKLDDQLISSYLERSQAYLAMRQYPEALADVQHAVALGGRFYLDEQANVEERMGNLNAAINDLTTFIGPRTPGPETSTFYVKLAALQSKDGRFLDAVKSANKATILPILVTHYSKELGLKPVSNNYLRLAQME
jgi:tetratricopeptide (TPR) repeat protein